MNKWLLKAASKYSKLFNRDTITVSEAVFPCLRKAYYDRTRKRLPSPVEALKSLGSELHIMIQDVLRDEGWDVEVSLGIDVGEFKLVGRVDAVKGDEVIELKTTNGVREYALESHMLQLQAYMTLLHAKRGYLIYIDRASGRVKVFEARPNKYALRRVIERAKRLHEALERHEPPPPHHGSWCSLCAHRWVCFRLGGGKRWPQPR